MIKIVKRLTRQILLYEEMEMEHVESELEEWFCFFTIISIVAAHSLSGKKV